MSAANAVETRAVLADAYTGKNRSLKEGRLLTHAVEVDKDGGALKLLCNRVAVDSIADVASFGGDYADVPTCERCARKDPRRRTEERR